LTVSLLISFPFIALYVQAESGNNFSDAAPVVAVSVSREKSIRPAGKDRRAIPDEDGRFREKTPSL